MKIVSWNVNGLRAVERNNFVKNFAEINADIMCLQEIKARPEQLSSQLRTPFNYQSFFNPAQKKGYGGVKWLKTKDKKLAYSKRDCGV